MDSDARSGPRMRRGGELVDHPDVETEIDELGKLDTDSLRARWRWEFGKACSPHLSKSLLMRLLAYRVQARAYGDLSRESKRLLDSLVSEKINGGKSNGSIPLPGQGRLMKGTVLMREHEGHPHHVMVAESGFIWNGTNYPSLSKVAFAITGTKWNGPRFFGLRERKKA